MNRLILILCLLFVALPALATPPQQGYTAFSTIPVLQDGRVKPIDTFARALLLTVNGKSSIYDEVNNQKLTATQWLAELIFNPANSYKRPVFNIPNPQVVQALELEWQQKHRYSFTEITKAIRNQFETIEKIRLQSEEKRSLEQQQLLDLYLKTLQYFQVSRSLSLLWPSITAHDKHLAKWLNVEIKKPYSYFQLMKNHQDISKRIERIRLKKPADMSDMEKDFVQVWFQMELVAKDSTSEDFAIIPDLWKKENWYAPWQLLPSGSGSPQTAEYMRMWQKMSEAYQTGDMAAWHQTAIQAQEFIYKIAPTNTNLLKLEVLYNTLQPFQASLALYVLAFVLLIFSIIFRPILLSRLSFISLSMGALVHLSGLIMRIIIMQRPPVATLYESIIFVGIIAVIFALIIETKRKDKSGLIIGSSLGAVLQFIGMRYALEGDTMGMLVAVLNTNFWLATHVVTITIGYGCCLVGGVLGHVYLIQKALKYKTNRLNNIAKSMLSVTLVALFFAVLGTILGGIWADQSWGRFWGWDPKENGAMLICLWLIWVVHGRITGFIKPFGFALSMVITNIAVALAWFGVNLLGVGLHSYGFTSGIAFNLALFCGIETLFILVISGYILYHKRRREA